MLPEKDLRKADVVGSSVLVLLGLAVIIGALRMPLGGSHGGSEVHWYTSPAILPLLLGILLVSFSVAVLVKAVRRGGHHALGETIVRVLKNLPRNAAVRRVVIIWLLLGAYIALLALHPFAGLSRVFDRLVFLHSSFATEPEVANYIPCSTLFLAAFMTLFYYRVAGGSRARRAAIVGVMSLSIPWLVAFLFKVTLYAPLPW